MNCAFTLKTFDNFRDICVCVCVCVVCVCVCVRTSIHREGFICLDSWNVSKQINDVMLKTWVSFTKFRLRYFRMKL